jgi:hypothetical protein
MLNERKVDDYGRGMWDESLKTLCEKMFNEKQTAHGSRRAGETLNETIQISENIGENWHRKR